MDYATLTETVNGLDQKILTQFIADAANFEAALVPHMIIRYENVVALDTNLGSNIYEIKVSYLNNVNEKYLYLFRQIHGQLPGQYRIDRIPLEQESAKSI